MQFLFNFQKHLNVSFFLLQIPLLTGIPTITMNLIKICHIQFADLCTFFKIASWVILSGELAVS